MLAKVVYPNRRRRQRLNGHSKYLYHIKLKAGQKMLVPVALLSK